MKKLLFLLFLLPFLANAQVKRPPVVADSVSVNPLNVTNLNVSQTTTTDSLSVTNHADINKASIDTLLMANDTITDVVTLDSVTGNLANSTTPLDTAFTTVWSDGFSAKKMLTITLADDATYNMPIGDYLVEFVTSDATERSHSIRIFSDGSAVVDASYGSLGTVNTDTDNKVNFYDGGSNNILKNRTGSEKTFIVFITILL